jgi:DNA primase
VDLRDAVLARVDLAELAGHYLSLKRAGQECTGRCPFHEEKSPSFHVNPEKGLFYCFGCKAGGNAIDFIMRIENLEFRDALEWLANRLGIDPAAYRPAGAAGVPGGKERLYQLNESAARFFRNQLRTAGEEARRYLVRRGVGERQIAEFDLGYAPRQWQALADTMLGEGVKAADLVSLGLIKPRTGEMIAVAGGEQGSYYDTFRHRLIFPIRSATGRVIAFAGRALSDEDTPKYLNVTNTPLYDKGHVLYNLDRAKGQMRESGAVVVEGYMDVIGLSAAGVDNAVASCGTALTVEHVRLLKRYAELSYLAFDGDEAGRDAAWNVGRLFPVAGLEVRAVPLPAGVDPDELVRRKGKEAWDAALAEALNVWLFWLENQRRAKPRTDTATLRRWVIQLGELYRQLPDELTRQRMKQDVADFLHLGGEEVAGLLGGEVQGRASSAVDAGQPSGFRPQTGVAQERRLRSIDTRNRGERLRQEVVLQGAMPVEREVLRRLVADEEFRYLYSVQGKVEPYIDAREWFADPLHREVYEELAGAADSGVLVHDPRFEALFAEMFSREPLMDENEQLLLRHRNYHLEMLVHALEAEHRIAVREGNHDRQAALLSKVLEIKHYIVPVRGYVAGER